MHAKTPFEFPPKSTPWTLRCRPQEPTPSFIWFKRCLLVCAALGLCLVVGGVALMSTNNCGGGCDHDTAQIQIKNVRDALELFKIKYGRYPTKTEGLQLLLTPPGGRRPLMGTLPEDPWGHGLIYKAPVQDERFEVYSLGPDGLDGTEDDFGRRRKI